ncbi:MAG: hypothetical protein AB8B85_00620 [Paracoccaceae bacterium]
MTHEAPDERRDFTGWSVERFGDRCFVNYSVAAPAGIGRTEILRAELDAAMSGERKLSDLVPRSARRDPLLEKTPEWAKIVLFVVTSISVGLIITVAVMWGWEWL